MFELAWGPLGGASELVGNLCLSQFAVGGRVSRQSGSKSGGGTGLFDLTVYVAGSSWLGQTAADSRYPSQLVVCTCISGTFVVDSAGSRHPSQL